MMKRNAVDRRRGFTLIEIAVASLIGAMLILVIGNMFRVASRSFGQTNEKLDALQSATMISEILHRDLRYMVIPVLAAPTKTDANLVAIGNNNNVSNPDPNAPPDPNAAPSATLPPPPDEKVADLDTLLPFLTADANEPRPSANPAVVYDMTIDQKPFVFYKNKVQTQGGGILGGATTAKFDLQQITYSVVPSGKFKDPQLFGLKRTVHEARVIPATSSSKEKVEKGSEISDRFYRSFYFRRLLLSLHEAPEAGIADGSPPPAPTATAPPSGPSSTTPPALTATKDTLYFLRLMVAGASDGSGARRIKKAGEKGAAANTQTLDLLVNLIHLDGVTERFRSRSLARNWNSELPNVDDD